MRFASLVLCTALCGAPFAAAQKLELKFDALAAKASAKAELDLDANLLRLVTHLAKDSDLDGLLSGVRAIHVRNYEFSKAGAYSQKDLEHLRNQVAAQSRWSRIANVKEDETT